MDRGGPKRVETRAAPTASGTFVQLQRQAETEARLIPVDLGAVDSIQPMRVRVAIGGSTGGKSLFAQISINTPQPLGSKNRPIRICFGISPSFAVSNS